MRGRPSTHYAARPTTAWYARQAVRNLLAERKRVAKRPPDFERDPSRRARDLDRPCRGTMSSAGGISSRVRGQPYSRGSRLH